MPKKISNKKVRLSKKINDFNPQNLKNALDWLVFIKEELEAEGKSLEEALKETPWTLDDFRRYAKKDRFFAKVLQRVDKVDPGKPIKSIQSLSKKDPKEEKSVSKPKKVRELTPWEKARIQKLQEKKGDRSFSDIFRVNDAGELEAADSDLSRDDRFKNLEAKMMEATGFTYVPCSVEMIARAVGMSVSKEVSHEKFVIEVNRFCNFLKEFQPKDAIEGTLCMQLVVCQRKAFDLISLAEIQKNVEWARTHYNAALKLLARAQSSIQTLISYRRGGEQKVVVEHVHVEAGGQAIVGHVEHPGGGAK